MEKKYITVNIGSSSKRYAFFKGELLILSAHFEHEDNKSYVTFINKERELISSHTFEYAFKTFVDELKGSSYMKDEEDINGIGMRIVAPGEYFSHHRLIDSDFIKHFIGIEKKDIAHITPVLK